MFTTQYNALERAYHEGALIGLLSSLHDELDAAVAQAYGWPADLSDEEILERLVALNHERAEEEARGLVRWLRPELQAPGEVAPTQAPLSIEPKKGPATSAPRSAWPWPKEPQARLLALRDALRAAEVPLSPQELTTAFAGARRPAVEAALQTLSALGVAAEGKDGRYTAAG